MNFYIIFAFFNFIYIFKMYFFVFNTIKIVINNKYFQI